MHCSALLFDLDGTLIDSAASAELHWRRWVDGIGLDWEAVRAFMHGVPTREVIARFAPHLDSVAEAEALEAAQAADTTGVVPMPGAIGLLESLPPDRWAVVTSGTRVVAAARLDRADLPRPGVLITADDVRHGKPNPEAFVLGARRLGVAPGGAVVVEDSEPGIEAGRSGGFRVIAIGALDYGADLHVPGVGALQVTVHRDGLIVSAGRCR